ncbi:Inositol oxygenase [Cinara cedri]|uniref:Inositol oxygenase n=1 Tax=Cinara cedri TaxID=506608 RepID=A0A5E4MIE6_9HEMI|nr:Inositol oxygenase [Cinara cedri]
MIKNKINILDVSELMRPELEFASKQVGQYRDYSIDSEDPIKERVRITYTEMHANQTVDYVKRKMAQWLSFDKFESTIMEVLESLNDLVDESDPDVDIPNIIHAYQTAERIRAIHPNHDWFHLVGLIHDLGKVMIFKGEPQWSVVGDTFPVGCAWGNSIVYRDTTFNGNPDTYDPRFNTKIGIYAKNCGLNNVLMSWGHDEYLYRVLLHNKTTIPRKGLHMIRFHSFYPWHSGGDYDFLCTKEDLEMKKWVLEFNKFDLYTKGGTIPDIEELKPYYQSLIDKYIPGLVKW